MVAVAIVCGLGGGLGAVALRELIRLAQELFFGPGEELLPILATLSLKWRVLAPAIGGLIVGPLVYFVAREAKGHGVPEVMEAMMLRGGAIRPRVVVVKAIASAISIGSGGSVGREGPIVQIGAALGSTLGQMLGVSTQQLRTLVGCGAAAGIAAAFNAPIAGALFAVEILLGDFGVPQFSPIVLASVVATVVSRHFLGDFPAFQVPAYQLVSPFELIPYMVLGLISGLVAVAFVIVLYESENLFEKFPIPEPLKAPVGGLMIGALALALPQVFGVGYETINAALAGQLSVSLLIALLVGKILATSITLASGGSGGVFAPSLFLGAMTGGALGTLVHQLFPFATATSGAYALVAMGAVVGAATHAPITAIIIIFELTADYHIIPPLMAACVVSSLLAMWLRRDSIYTLKLRLRGLDPFKQDDPNPLKSLYIRDVLDPKPEVVAPSMPFERVLDLVVMSPHTEFFVCGDNGMLLGGVSFSEVRRVIFEQQALAGLVVAADLVDRSIPVVHSDDSLDVVMRLFNHRDDDELPVVDDADGGRLVGSVHRRDVIDARNEAVLRRDLVGSMSSTVSLLGRVSEVDVGDGYVVEEIPSPRAFNGHSLRELDIPSRYGVQVIFIRSRVDGTARLRTPTADDCPQEGDTLIVTGPGEAARRLHAL